APRPLLQLARGKAAGRHVLAIANLSAAVRSGEDRPVARRTVFIFAMRHPHIEILPGADEARVSNSLAGVTGIVDRALEADRQVERVELVKLVLFRGRNANRLVTLTGRPAVAGAERESGDDRDRRKSQHGFLLHSG